MQIENLIKKYSEKLLCLIVDFSRSPNSIRSFILYLMEEIERLQKENEQLKNTKL